MPVVFWNCCSFCVLHHEYSLNVYSSRGLCACKSERVERDVGGGIGMGNTCKPMAVSFQCMTKSTTNKKKI